MINVVVALTDRDIVYAKFFGWLGVCMMIPMNNLISMKNCKSSQKPHEKQDLIYKMWISYEKVWRVKETLTCHSKIRSSDISFFLFLFFVIKWELHLHDIMWTCVMKSWTSWLLVQNMLLFFQLWAKSYKRFWIYNISELLLSCFHGVQNV